MYYDLSTNSFLSTSDLYDENIGMKQFWTYEWDITNGLPPAYASVYPMFMTYNIDWKLLGVVSWLN